MTKSKIVFSLGILVVVLAVVSLWYFSPSRTENYSSDLPAKPDEQTSAIPGYNNTSSPRGSSSGQSSTPSTPVQGSSNIDTIISDINADANSDESISKESDSEANSVSDQPNFNLDYASQL